MESNATTMPVNPTRIASPRPMGAPSYLSAHATSATQVHQGTTVWFAALVGGGRTLRIAGDDSSGSPTCDPPD